MRAKDLEQAAVRGTLLALVGVGSFRFNRSELVKVRVTGPATHQRQRGPKCWNAVDAETGEPIAVYDKKRSAAGWRSYDTTNIPSRNFLGEWDAVVRERADAAAARRREYEERQSRDHANRIEMAKVADQIREFLDRDDLIITTFAGSTGSNLLQGVKIILKDQRVAPADTDTDRET